MDDDAPWLTPVLRRAYAVALETTGSATAAQEVAATTAVAVWIRRPGDRGPSRRALAVELAAALRASATAPALPDGRPGRRERRRLSRALKHAPSATPPPVLFDDVRSRISSMSAARRSAPRRRSSAPRRRSLVAALVAAAALAAVGVVAAAARFADTPTEPQDVALPSTTATDEVGPTSTTPPRPTVTTAPPADEPPPPVSPPVPTLTLAVACEPGAHLRWSAYAGASFANYLVLRRVGDDPRYPHAGTRTELRGGTRSADAVELADGSTSPPTGARWMVVAVDADGTELARSAAAGCA